MDLDGVKHHDADGPHDGIQLLDGVAPRDGVKFDHNNGPNQLLIE